MEKPIKKSYHKTHQQDPDSPSILVIYIILIVIIAVWISIYYDKLKQRINNLYKNFKLSKHTLRQKFNFMNILFK